jgi:glycosyltransferase involved in cell wall biosynthesis
MPKNKQQKLLIVMPCYNEAKVIGEVVRSTKELFDKSGYNHEVLVVDDCSSDDSAAKAERAGAIVVRHIVNLGAGGSTATGLSYARKHGFDMAVSMDSDGQHDPSDALACVKKLTNEGVDLVIGSRMVDPEGMSRVKMLGNWGLTVVTRVLFGVKTTDSQSGLRAYSKRAINILDWTSTGYAFCSEMLMRARKAGLNIAEQSIRVIYTDYSRGKGQNNWNGVNIVIALLRCKLAEVLR